jgi:hypothetical protein
VVVRIFERKAAGQRFIRIAKELQQDGIPSPVRITEIGRQRRALKNQERIEAGLEPLKPIEEKWTSDGIKEILKRELYRGVLVRGRVKRGKVAAARFACAWPRPTGSGASPTIR